MRIGLILFSILFLYSCKKDVKITDISGDCILEKGSIVKKDTSQVLFLVLHPLNWGTRKI